MLEKLQQVAERYFVASVFAVFGVINSEPWPFILGFIAFGAAIDIWFAKASAAALGDRPKGEQTADPSPRRSRLIPFFMGYIAVAFSIYVVATALKTNHPALLATLGPVIYDLASPFIALLRNHYQDLAAHGLSERANIVAVIYAGLFLLFYSGLGFGLGKIAYSKAPNPPHGAPKSSRQNGGDLRGGLLLLLLVLGIIHFMTWANIDYSDHHHSHYRRRHHINFNLAEFDSFFWMLAFMQDLLVFALPFLLCLTRLLPRSALPPSR